MSVNKVILLGNVGKDPETKVFENGQVSNFPLATSERGYKTANGTEVPERTEWHNIVVWGGLSKVVDNYVRKGRQLYVEGKIRTRSYDDATGNKRYITEIVADNIELLGGRNDDNGHTPPTRTETKSSTNNSMNIPSIEPPKSVSSSTPKVETKPDPIDDGEDIGDDLPF